MSEVLVGSRRYLTPYAIHFKQNVENVELCKKPLTKAEVNTFSEAVHDEYYIEFLLDDLPFWVYVGDSKNEDLLFGHRQETKHYLYTHINFEFGYNANQIVFVNATTPADKKIDVSDENDKPRPDPFLVTFTYSVKWTPSEIPYKDRMEKYLTSGFLPKSTEIHWVFIINSAILVIILALYIMYILANNLRKDFAAGVLLDDENGSSANNKGENTEEIGWKLIHGDVFRNPNHISIFSAIIGNGIQIMVTAIIMILVCQFGIYGPNRRGALVFTLILIYCLTTFINGYCSATLYKQLSGTNWAWNIITSAFLYPFPTIIIFLFMNSVADVNNSSAALPFTTILAIGALFFFIGLPLCIVGGIIGKNYSSVYIPPCRVRKVPRQIPHLPWYHQTISHIIIGGILPFSSIYVEMFYIFGSVWGHMYYTFFGILTIALFLLLLVTSLLTISLTYFLLTCENHEWWWRTISSGGATGIFLYLYSIIYYNTSTQMNGFLQGVFFFGYMAIISYGVFLLLGSIGFCSSWGFVRYIYSSLKFD